VDTMMFKEILPQLLELLLIRAQSQLPLKLTKEYSNFIRVVSFLDQLVEPTLITVLPLLDMVAKVERTMLS